MCGGLLRLLRKRTDCGTQSGGKRHPLRNNGRVGGSENLQGKRKVGKLEQRVCAEKGGAADRVLKKVVRLEEGNGIV